MPNPPLPDPTLAEAFDLLDGLDLPPGLEGAEENLRRAIGEGRIEARPDGRFALSAAATRENGAHIRVKGADPRCPFLLQFLFATIYGRTTVPFGCRSCYKVRVLPRTVAELAALKAIAPRMPVRSKWGPDIQNPVTTSVYSGHLYAFGLDQAREVADLLRAEIAGHPGIGADLPVSIKRGCTTYELHCGPSDTWTIRPELEALEARLEERFVAPPDSSADPRGKGLEKVAFMRWLQAAHRIGDMTYLEFTDGKPFYPRPVIYR